METKASFQFKGFSVKKSIIEINGDINSELNLKFIPSGKINYSDKSFQLELGLLIEDTDKKLNINVVFIGDYQFSDENDVNFENFLFLNSPSILFPYIRAYVSSLTCLSGIAPITLPTLNLVDLKDELKENTITV